MIACPKCGRETRVKETRGERRTRICVACAARIVTVELPVDVSLEDAARALRGVR